MRGCHAAGPEDGGESWSCHVSDCSIDDYEAEGGTIVFSRSCGYQDRTRTVVLNSSTGRVKGGAQLPKDAIVDVVSADPWCSPFRGPLSREKRGTTWYSTSRGTKRLHLAALPFVRSQCALARLG